MIKFDSSRIIKKQEEVVAKINSVRKKFENMERKVRQDLEKAGKIWKEMRETLDKKRRG